MHKTTLALVLSLLAAAPVSAAGRHRIVSLPAGPQAILTAEVRDLVTGSPVVGVEVEGPRRFARSDAAGRFTMELPVGMPVTLTFSRSGYEALTESFTISGPASRTFRLQALPTATITTTSGVTHIVDADTVEFGYAIPFSGYRRDRTATMCRPGTGRFTLDRAEIDRVEGPAVSLSDPSCCAKGPLSGAAFQLANGERITAFFTDSCDGAVMEVIARDHVTWELVFVPLSQLREVILP